MLLEPALEEEIATVAADEGEPPGNEDGVDDESNKELVVIAAVDEGEFFDSVDGVEYGGTEGLVEREVLIVKVVLAWVYPTVV